MSNVNQLPECPQGEACWSQDWTQQEFPCTHGHFDCARFQGGPCLNEHTATYFHPGDPLTDSDAIDYDDAPMQMNAPDATADGRVGLR